MMKHLKALALAVVLLVTGSTGVTAYAQGIGPSGWNATHILDTIQWGHGDLVMLAAHRGVHALWASKQYTNTPENSFESIYNAAANNIEVVEVDVRLSQDGVPMINHDATWGRNTNVGSTWEPNNLFDPWHPTPAGQDNNPKLSDWSVASAQRTLTLRNSLNFGLSKWYGPGFQNPWVESPMTLQNLLDYVKTWKLNIVLALDIKDVATTQASWYVVKQNTDYRGNPYWMSTFFKMSGTLYSSPGEFQEYFNGYTQVGNGYTPDWQLIRWMPVYNTSDIAPFGSSTNRLGFGNEQQIVNSIQSHQGQPYLLAVELNQKQPGGILSWTYGQVNYRSTIGNFNPYEEWVDPNDGYKTPQFFGANTGSCCAAPRSWFYDGSQYGQSSDTDDQRLSWPFLYGLNSSTGNYAWPNHIITTDNVVPMAVDLKNKGMRNTNYYY